MRHSVSEIVSPVLTSHRARSDSLIKAAVGDISTPAPLPAATLAPLDSGLTEYRLKHLDTLSAGALLRGLFPDNSPTGLRWAVMGRRSMVMLAGAPPVVNQAVSALTHADIAPGHILIEATVVQFNREVVRQFALSLDQAAKGTVRDAAVQLGSLVNPAVTFTSVLGSGNTQGFRASIDALENEQLARVIARPYVTARSGDSASVTVGRDRYIVTTAFGGNVNSGSQQVTTGVLLRFLPLAMPDSMVKMAVSVEQSEFIPTEGNEAVQVDKSAATTIMQVRSGQTIVIGGLSVERDSRYESGLPFLRRLWPFAATNARGTDHKRLDVVILVTPYLWTPGTVVPDNDRRE
jgi:type II secretory pathway component GspD/PulD (secretin)